MLGAGSEAKIVESYFGVSGRAYFCNAVTELVGAAGRHHRALSFAARERQGISCRHVGGELGAGLPSDRPCGDFKRRAGAQQRARAVRTAKARRACSMAFISPRQAAYRQLHINRACQPTGAAAWSCTKGFLAAQPMEYSTAKSSSTKMRRSPMRARPTRILLLSENAVGQHQTAIGNLCRRCQMQPWLDHRPAGSRRDVLSALARHWMWRRRRSLLSFAFASDVVRSDENRFTCASDWMSTWSARFGGGEVSYEGDVAENRWDLPAREI